MENEKKKISLSGGEVELEEVKEVKEDHSHRHRHHRLPSHHSVAPLSSRAITPVANRVTTSSSEPSKDSRKTSQRSRASSSSEITAGGTSCSESLKECEGATRPITSAGAGAGTAGAASPTTPAVSFKSDCWVLPLLCEVSNVPPLDEDTKRRIELDRELQQHRLQRKKDKRARQARLVPSTASVRWQWEWEDTAATAPDPDPVLLTAQQMTLPSPAEHSQRIGEAAKRLYSSQIASALTPVTSRHNTLTAGSCTAADLTSDTDDLTDDVISDVTDKVPSGSSRRHKSRLKEAAKRIFTSKMSCARRKKPAHVTGTISLMTEGEPLEAHQPADETAF